MHIHTQHRCVIGNVVERMRTTLIRYVLHVAKFCSVPKHHQILRHMRIRITVVQLFDRKCIYCLVITDFEK